MRIGSGSVRPRIRIATEIWLIIPFRFPKIHGIASTTFRIILLTWRMVHCTHQTHIGHTVHIRHSFHCLIFFLCIWQLEVKEKCGRFDCILLHSLMSGKVNTHSLTSLPSSMTVGDCRWPLYCLSSPLIPVLWHLLPLNVATTTSTLLCRQSIVFWARAAQQFWRWGTRKNFFDPHFWFTWGRHKTWPTLQCVVYEDVSVLMQSTSNAMYNNKLVISHSN